MKRLDNKSRKASIIESISNLVVGTIINTALTFSLLELLYRNEHFVKLGLEGDWYIAAINTVVYTIVSVLRSYTLRRTFVWLGKER